jgi:hypothetical protein
VAARFLRPRKVITIAGALAISAALAIGGHALLRPYLANKRADASFAQALSQARGGDAWALLCTLDAKRKAINAARDLPPGADRPSLETRVLAREHQLLEEAIGAGNRIALVTVMDGDDAQAPLADDPGMRAWRSAKRPDFTALVRAIQSRPAASLTAADAWVLNVAGGIALRDRQTARSAQDALALFTVAYGAGYEDAAYGAAQAARAAGQATEAYRWAVRCNGTCRAHGLDLSQFQAKVSSDEIALVQATNAPVIVDHRQAK